MASSQYNVPFFGNNIFTTVTKTSSVVTDWLSSIQCIHSRRLNRLIVGLDTEWRPYNLGNPVAILQLCVGRQCLIFQILHCDIIPQSLIDFFGNNNYTFVGVGIKNDVDKLFREYNLWVSCTTDLRYLAVEKLNMEKLGRAGLKTLTSMVLNKEIEKPKNITVSRWDNFQLSIAQVHYACIDAFVSFEIGRTLICEY